MLEYFIRNGVKVSCLNSDVMAQGITYHAGTYVIDMHQAKRGLVNLVLSSGLNVSEDSYVTAAFVQDFPVLRGFDCYEIREKNAFKQKISNITKIVIPSTKITHNSQYTVIRNSNNDAIKAVNWLLTEGKPVIMMEISQNEYNPGDFVVITKDLMEIVADYYLEIGEGLDEIPEGKELKTSKVATWGEDAYVLRELGFDVVDSEEEGDILVNTFEPQTYIDKGIPYIAHGYMGMLNLESSKPAFSYLQSDMECYEASFLTEVNQESAITAPYDEEEYMYSSMFSYMTEIPEKAEVLLTISEDEDFFLAGWLADKDSTKGKILAFTYHEDGKNVTVFANNLTNGCHSQNQYRLLANSIFHTI